MGLRDLFGGSIFKWREPFGYRLRLRGDVRLRLCVVLAGWAMGTGVMCLIFAYNNNPPGLGVAIGLGAVIGLGPFALGTLLRRELSAGTVWVQESMIRRQRNY